MVFRYIKIKIQITFWW